MKNKIISIIAAGFLLFTPQLALAAENGEKPNPNDKAPRDEKAPAEGSAAGAALISGPDTGTSTPTNYPVVAMADDFTLTNLELRDSTETGEAAAGLSHASMKGMFLLTVLELAARGEPRGIGEFSRRP